jgi:hypothetical protein
MTVPTLHMESPVSRRKRDLWTPMHEVERLAQLQLDVDSATERLIKQCVRVSNEVPEAQRDEWLRRAGLADEFRDWALRDCKRFIEKCTKGQL